MHTQTISQLSTTWNTDIGDSPRKTQFKSMEQYTMQAKNNFNLLNHPFRSDMTADYT